MDGYRCNGWIRLDADSAVGDNARVQAMSFDSSKGIPVRGIDRKLDALKKRMEAERKKKSEFAPPIDGLTNTLSTENVNIANKPRVT
jgi:hypothetical protein